MSIEQKAKKQIMNIIELIINLVALALAAGKSCVDCESNIRSQFVDATIFGYFIVNSLVVLSIFIEAQEFHKYWRLAVALLGAVLFLIAGALILAYISEYSDFSDYDSNVTIITCIGILCLVMVVLYIIDAFLVFKDK